MRLEMQSSQDAECGMTPITLVFRLEDFDDEPSDDGLNPDEMDCTCSASVIQLEPHLFRVREPISLTPFGPLGPVLAMGTVFEAELQEDGTYRYTGIRESPPVWTRTLCPVPQECLHLNSARSMLDQLIEAGCGWEWTAGNVTIQGALSEGQTGPEARVAMLLTTLEKEIITSDQSLSV